MVKKRRETNHLKKLSKLKHPKYFLYFIISFSLLVTFVGMISGMYLINTQSFDFRKQASSTASWADSSYKYRKVVSITNNTQKTKNDYSIGVKETDKNVIQKMQNDCDDVLFTTENGTPLNHWKRFCELDKAVFLVKIPKLFASNDTPNIIMYYGNSSAISKSDGSKVFEYYQEFDNFNPTVKFGLISDIHHDTNDNAFWNGLDFENSYLKNAKGRMNTFVTAMNNWNADFIMSLGDMITTENWVNSSGKHVSGFVGQLGVMEQVETPQEAILALQQIEAEYSKFNKNRYYAFDNHEFYNLSLDQVLNNTGGQGATKLKSDGTKKSYYSFIKGGVKFIILDLQYNNGVHRGPEASSNYGMAELPEFERIWLKQELASGNEPVIIFSSQRMEEHDFLYGSQCNNPPDNYCTNCAGKDSGPCVNPCKVVGDYRRLEDNHDIITNILAPHKDKILAVFQGNDHAAFHYVQDGINFWSLNAADQNNDSEVAYLKIEIDPTQKLLAIEGLGGINKSNTFKISYSNGKMILSSSKDLQFQPALLPMGKTWNNDVMTESKWQSNPQNPFEQFAMGYFHNLDHMKIKHQCASNGRVRFSSFIGARKVKSKDGLFLGTEFWNVGEKQVSKDIPSTATEGRFWIQMNDNKVRFWYNDGDKGGKLPTEYSISGAPQMNPGVWLFDDADGVSGGQLDYFMVRTAVYPEPITSLGVQESKN